MEYHLWLAGSRPTRARGLKLWALDELKDITKSRPTRARGLKLGFMYPGHILYPRRAPRGRVD